MAQDELTQLKFDMNDMKNDVKNIATDVSELKDDLKQFIKDAEKRFAGKWTEKALVSIFSIVGLAVLTAILSVVIIK